MAEVEVRRIEGRRIEGRRIEGRRSSVEGRRGRGWVGVEVEDGSVEGEGQSITEWEIERLLVFSVEMIEMDSARREKSRWSGLGCAVMR